MYSKVFKPKSSDSLRIEMKFLRVELPKDLKPGMAVDIHVTVRHQHKKPQRSPLNSMTSTLAKRRNALAKRRKDKIHHFTNQEQAGTLMRYIYSFKFLFVFVASCIYIACNLLYKSYCIYNLIKNVIVTIENFEIFVEQLHVTWTLLFNIFLELFVIF